MATAIYSKKNKNKYELNIFKKTVNNVGMSNEQ